MASAPSLACADCHNRYADAIDETDWLRARAR